MADESNQADRGGPPSSVDYGALSVAGVFLAATLVHRMASGDRVDR